MCFLWYNNKKCMIFLFNEFCTLKNILGDIFSMEENEFSVEVKGSNTLGITALVISIIAIIGCWIPFINIISILLALASGIISIVSIIITFKNKFTSKTLPISALAISVFCIIFSFAINNTYSSKSSSKSSTSSTSESSENNRSSDKSENKEVEKSQYAVGDVIKFDDKEVTVTNVKRNYNTGNEFSRPKSGKEFVKVTVKVRNKSDNTISIDLSDFKIQDSNGVIDTYSAPTFSLEDELETTQLAPEGTITGSIIFEVPKGDKNLVLIYKPNFWYDKKIEIKL